MGKVMATPEAVQRDYEHSLDNPADDWPAGPVLESFVEELGKAFRPRPDFPPLTLDGLARRFSAALCPALPLAPQLYQFVENMGISIVTHTEGWGTSGATYVHNPQISQWEIHVPPGLGMIESRNIVHDVFEIMFWRCYHKIKWWRAWAAQNKDLYYPHDSADEFAFLVVLNPQRFTHKAKKNNYDLWALEKRCHTSANMCFQALTRFVSLPFPCFHALLNFSTTLVPREPVLFALEEAQDTPATVRYKCCKQAKRKGEAVDLAELDEDERRSWQPVLDFQRFPRNGASVFIQPNDVVMRARDKGLLITTARRVAGYGVTGDVSVILRPSTTSNQVYLQAVPVGCEREMIQYDQLEALL